MNALFLTFALMTPAEQPKTVAKPQACTSATCAVPRRFVFKQRVGFFGRLRIRIRQG